MPQPPLFPVLRSLAICLALVLFVWASAVPAPSPARALAAVGNVTTDGAAENLPPPEAPLQGQITDCKARVHQRINGGCWRKLADAPPCLDAYLWRGGCFIPVMKPPRPNTSLQP